MATTAPSNEHFKRALKAGFYLHLDVIFGYRWFARAQRNRMAYLIVFNKRFHDLFTKYVFTFLFTKDGNSSHESVDCKAPNSIHNNALGISNTVSSDISGMLIHDLVQ